MIVAAGFGRNNFSLWGKVSPGGNVHVGLPEAGEALTTFGSEALLDVTE